MAEISKAGIPDKNTVGRLGDICINTVTGDRYKLAYISTTTTYDGTYTDYEWVFINDGFLSADTIKKVDIVTELPEKEENGVLYVVSDGVIANIVKINGTIIYDRYESLLIVRYTASESGLIPTFNSGYADYTVEEEDNGDGTYTISVMANNIDNPPTNISFNGKTNLLTVEKFNAKNTSKVTSMSSMFSGCSSLTSLDLRGFDTSNVTNMSSMFAKCSSLTSLDLRGFDTSNVTSMVSMFSNCSSLTSLDLRGFDTSNVANMMYMFHACSNLTSLDVSDLDTSNVTNIANMFISCINLTSLDLSRFDISNVTNSTNIFYGCSNLTSLDSMTNICVDLALPSTLNQESVLDVVDNLATVTSTKTLKISRTQLSWISEDKMLEANNKGWTISV